MRKLIAILVLIIISAIVCLSTTMASFSISEMKMKMHMNMQDWVMGNSDCFDTMFSNFSKNNPECCFSLFKEFPIYNWSKINQKDDKKLKIKKIDFNLLALLQDSSIYNYIEKLNSPPNLRFLEKNYNSYIDLIWIIKNNC